MGQNEHLEPDEVPTPPVVDAATAPVPVHIVEATQPPMFPDVPTAPAMADGYSDPTTVLPVQVVPARPVQPAVSIAYSPVQPVYAEERVVEERFIQSPRRPAWPYIAAVVALLLGGVAGFLIGSAGDDEKPAAETAQAGDVRATFDVLLARTRADGEYKSPSEYPQLDEITEIDNSAATKNLTTQVEMLTIAQKEAEGLTGQVTLLETAVADLTVERDALAAQVAGNGGTSADRQAQLDAANAEIASLTSDLATARSDLATANAALKIAQADLATANAVVADLKLMPAPNYINVDIAKVRAEAVANGWTLIEQPTDSTTVAAGAVLDQAPAANANMVKGSVLYVKVAKRP